jgi:UPF0755 protein
LVDARGQRHDADSLSARLASSLGRTAPKSPSEALRPEIVPPPPPRSRAARNPVVVVLNFAITAVLAAIVLIGGAVFAARLQFERPGGFDDAHTLTVRPGASADEVADAVQREGLGNRWVFIAGVRLAGAEGRLKAGEYLVSAHASLSDVMRDMVDGRVIVHSITFPEGLTSQQIVDCLMGDTILVNGYTSGLSARQVENCRNDAAGLMGTIAAVPAQGTLLPETYPFSGGDTRQAIIDRMKRDAARVLADVWSRRAPDLPLKSPDQLLTLASIIEKETSLADERSRIAAVYINRLRINMKLDADPTVTYAVFKGAAPPSGYRLTSADKQVKSDYNTYAVGGLPPGPIANPGRAALEAAANPSRTRDLYFVADATGGHVFAESYDDHQRNVARYRAASEQATIAPVNTGGPAAAPIAGGTLTGPSPTTTPPRPAGSPPPPQPRPATGAGTGRP